MLLPPKVEYESGFGATLITAGSIGLARPSKIQSQPWGPVGSALYCLFSPRLPVFGEAHAPWLQVLSNICCPSTQTQEVGPYPAHGASTPFTQPLQGTRIPRGRAADGNAAALQDTASPARGTLHAPEPLLSPNAWSRFVALEPNLYPGHNLGSAPRRAKLPWHQAGMPSHAQGQVGVTHHPLRPPCLLPPSQATLAWPGTA